MEQIILTGQDWQAKQYDPMLPDFKLPDSGGEWFAVNVPGAIHYDLTALKKLENPYSSTEAAFAAEWVAKSDWVYKTEFETPQNAAAMKTIMLRLEGVDTYSEVWLNGNLLGETANSYRVYDFPFDHSLFKADKKNELLVRIKSHVRMIASKIDETEKHLKNGRSPEGLLGKSLIRRYQRSFYAGSSLLNLGTGVLGMGIVRNVSLVCYPGAYITDCCFRTLSIEGGRANCKILLSANYAPNTLAKILIKSPGDKSQGTTVYNNSLPLEPGEMEIPLTIENAKLWHPRGYGKQNLYSLTVKIETDGRETDEVKQQVGIKTCELVTMDEKGRKTFYFKINGKKVIIHGQNHVPLDYIKSYRSKEEYRRIFDMLESQNVNMVRMWGGGVVEDDYFYEECDKRGIMLFQDFYLHSNQYPDYDEDWTKEFLAESQEILKKIRVHPSLCIICGGNETIEGWECWGWKQSAGRFNGEKLITQHLPAISARLCPDLPYIVNSPHGGIICQSPVEGEAHIWGNFYNSTKDPLFVTETCWTQESYSRPETLKKYMDLDVDEFAGNDWAEEWKAITSLNVIHRYPYTDWHETSNLRSYLRSLEIEQMRADYSALGMFRFASPNNSGVMYWSFTKGGPLFQFGCVDYGGHPLMSFYAVKKLFAPIAVLARRDVSDISVMLSNHSADAAVNVEVFHMHKDGRCLGFWSKDVQIKEQELTEVYRLKDRYNEVHNRTEETVYVSASINGELAADDMLFFCSYIEYSGEYDGLKVKTEKTGEGKWRLQIEAKHPVRMVELESSQKLLFSDNYFPIIPQKPKIIEVNLLERTNEGQVVFTAGILGSGNRQNFILD